MKRYFRRAGVGLMAAACVLTGGLAQADVKSPLATHSAMAVDLLRDAIARETVKGLGNVPAYAEHIRGVLLAAGFPESDLILIPQGETTSLVVRYRGDDSSGRKPILFSSHFDVVPANPDDWVRNPFELQEDQIFYYGRGVLDNKFDISILTTTFVWLRQEGFVPKRDLILAFTGDEETLQSTARMLTEQHRQLIDAEYAFIVDGGGGQLDEEGNPMQFQVGFAEKTYATFTVTARNPGGHSSMPRDDNAIFDLAGAIQAIRDYRFPVQTNEITLTFFERTAPLLKGKVGSAMADFVANPEDGSAVATLRQQPEYVGTLGTTCIPTMLEAGHAENALPQSATATVNCRIFPGNGVQETLDVLKQVVANDSLEWEVLDTPTASDPSPMNPEIMAAIKTSVDTIHPGVPVIPQMLSGATDGIFFRAAGIPSYSTTGIFLNPADDFAHGLNERVPKASVSESLVFWRAMIGQLAGSGVIPAE